MILKRKVLLLGKRKSVIDDFFTHLNDDFEMQTTSARYVDIISHLKYYRPDAMIFCLSEETADVMNVLTACKSSLEDYKIPLVIVGSEEECEDFQKSTYRMSSLVLTKPITLNGIRDRVLNFLNRTKPEKKTESGTETEEVKNDVTEETAFSPASETDELIKEIERMANPDYPVKTEEAPAVKKHILVVDDDPIMLKLIKEQLKDSYTVATAISGNVALKFLENKKTDLIILDYEMPGEDGAQVLEKIRSNSEMAKLPVVFLTGINDREKIQKVLDLKPQGYLLKPIEREKLIQIIAATIG